DVDVEDAFYLAESDAPPVMSYTSIIAFANKESLRCRFVETARSDFHLAMDISCYSLIALARRALPLLKPGASILTLTYFGAMRAMPNYNIMGVAKAALEATVRYLSADLGEQGVRVNAISAGPIKTLAASGVSGFRDLLGSYEKCTPLRRNVTTDDVGRSAIYLISELSSGVTGEVHYVDAGFNISPGLTVG
ncbi:MAG: SDR family oxidoreductase, partial [Acidobacteriota bacterium]